MGRGRPPDISVFLNNYVLLYLRTDVFIPSALYARCLRRGDTLDLPIRSAAPFTPRYVRSSSGADVTHERIYMPQIPAQWPKVVLAYRAVGREEGANIANICKYWGGYNKNRTSRLGVPSQPYLMTVRPSPVCPHAHSGRLYNTTIVSCTTLTNATFMTMSLCFLMFQWWTVVL